MKGASIKVAYIFSYFFVCKIWVIAAHFKPHNQEIDVGFSTFFYAPKPQRATLNYSAMAEKQQVLFSWSCTSSLGFCDHQIGTKSINCGQIAKMAFLRKSQRKVRRTKLAQFFLYIYLFLWPKVKWPKIWHNWTKYFSSIHIKHINRNGQKWWIGCKRGFNGFPRPPL